MTQRRRPVTKGRWRALALSVILHSGIVAAAVYGWFTWKSRPPEPVTLAIEGTVVDERALKNARPPEPAPEPPAPEPVPEPAPEPEPEEQGPPKPDPAELERKQEEERLAQEKLEQEKQQQELAEKERLETEKKEAEKKEAEKQAAAQKAAAEKAAAEKKAAEKKKAEDARKAAEEKARLAQQAELRRAMEAEERGNAVRNSDAAARWYASIVAKIERAWIRPPSAQPGVTCIVAVSQVPGGEVTSVRVESCSINDPALKQSVENAVYSASPLPAPPDPTLFERNLELTFAPK